MEGIIILCETQEFPVILSANLKFPWDSFLCHSANDIMLWQRLDWSSVPIVSSSCGDGKRCWINWVWVANFECTYENTLEAIQLREQFKQHDLIESNSYRNVRMNCQVSPPFCRQLSQFDWSTNIFFYLVQSIDVRLVCNRIGGKLVNQKRK